MVAVWGQLRLRTTPFPQPTPPALGGVVFPFLFFFVIFMQRSMGVGYAGAENPAFFKPQVGPLSDRAGTSICLAGAPAPGAGGKLWRSRPDEQHSTAFAAVHACPLS